MLCELPLTFAPCEFRIQRAGAGWEQEQALTLRRAVFGVELGVCGGHDRAAGDDVAQTLVALSCVGGMADQVVGTVRIHEAEPGLWWGSRLAVHAAFRSHGRIGATLIRLAVCSAHAQGCERFLAHVQAQNVPMFEKLHWHALQPEALHGRPHMLMQADLSAYPPCEAPHTAFVTRSSGVRS